MPEIRKQLDNRDQPDLILIVLFLELSRVFLFSSGNQSEQTIMWEIRESENSTGAIVPLESGFNESHR